MCGISGVAGNYLSKEDMEILRDLTIFSAARGMDSTGIMTARDRRYNNKNEPAIQVIKSTYTPNEFLKDDECRKMFNNSDLKAAVVHTRAATRGKISIENSHPFKFEHVTGVHNGTIFKNFPDHQKFETDSEGFYNLVNTRGIQEAVDIVGDNGAAYALVWFDERNGTLNFLRNDQRPLYFVYDTGHRTVYFSSEYMFLLTALRRRNKQMHESGIQMFKPHTLSCFEWNRHDGLKHWENKEIRPIVKEFPRTHGRSGSWRWSSELNKLVDMDGEEIEDFFSKPPANVNDSADCKVPEKSEQEVSQKKSPPQEQTREMATKPGKAPKQKSKKEASKREQEILEFHRRNNPNLPTSEKTHTAFHESLIDSGITHKVYKNTYYTNAEFEDILSNKGCSLCAETFSLGVHPAHYQITDTSKLIWTSPRDFICDDCQKQDWVADYVQQCNEEAAKEA